MNKWTRRYSWEEWRQLHPNLPLDEATRLYQEEKEWFEQFYEELQNLYRNRITTIVNNLSNLKTDFTDILEGRGTTPTSVGFTEPTSSVLTYTTPGSSTVTIPSTNPTEYSYNTVVAQVWGGGGAGQQSNIIDTLYIAGSGGGGGAFSSKTYTITNSSSISITVGRGATYIGLNDYALAGFSSVNIDTIPIVAGEGETLTSKALNNLPSSGGISTGGDTNINGIDGIIGNQIDAPVNGILKGGAGGNSPNGGVGGSGAITTVVDRLLTSTQNAANGEEPGAGGGGAAFIGDSSTPANGANGKVILTFSYQA